MNAMMLTYAYYTEEAQCYFEEDRICFDLETNQYRLEPEAFIRVQVPNQALQTMYTELWAQMHPEAIHQVEFVIGQEADLRYVEIHEAAFEFDQWQALDFRLGNSLLPTIASELNYTHLTYIPISGQGMALLSNLTTLEALGYPYVDENGDFTHDHFENFEAIEELQDLFPSALTPWGLSLQEPYAFYPYLTSHGWQLFPNAQGYDPGFHEETFLKALQWLENLSRLNANAQGNAEDVFGWNFQNLLEQDSFIFMQVAPFMFVEIFDEMHDSQWHISRFPSVENQAPMVPFLYDVYGYTLDQSSLYPSLAHEVLRMITQPVGLEAYTNVTQRPILRPASILNQINFSNPITQQFSYAHTSARSEPLIALDNSPTTVAFRLYFEINLMDTIQALWKGTITPEQAQIEIAMAADAWLNEYAVWLKEVQSDE